MTIFILPENDHVLLLQYGHYRNCNEYLATNALFLEDSTGSYTALLWQKEASDIPSKSELLMFSYFTYM